MNRKELSAICARCGQLAEGYAFIGDDRYCHPDDGVDCYTLASHDLTTLANQAFIEKAQASANGEREATVALAEYDRSQPSDYERSYAEPLAESLRALLRRPAQTEPTDAQVEQALAALSRFNGWNDNPHGAMRAALKAAFTAGQERAAEAQPRGKSCAVNGCRHAARWQDSGSVDYCACHYDDSAADEECAAGQEEQS